MMKEGVSVIICCHNSAKELPQTIAHLSAQQATDSIQWEVIVIDNASKDNTSQVAQALWPDNVSVPLRIVHEPKLGLINARYRGLAEAKYEFLSFIDDDNWVCQNWVQTVFKVMSSHPEVGACGGLNSPVLEEGSPKWFHDFSKSYAIGCQGPEKGGYTTWTKGRLFGAGLSIRKHAWQKLVDNGFQSLLVGSKGKTLSRGEDLELCYALVLTGWHLWYEPTLELKHNLPNERLKWQKLRKQRRGTGIAIPTLAAYEFAIREIQPESSITFLSKSAQEAAHPFKRKTWYQEAMKEIKNLFYLRSKFLLSLFNNLEGDPQVLMIEARLGTLIELLRQRENYDKRIEEVRNSKWRPVKYPIFQLYLSESSEAQ